MTTTDVQAERLARLRSRQSGPTDTDGAHTASTEAEPAPSGAPGPARRRRSPALSAKVLTVGASTSAMLGMMAGYGIADGRGQEAAPPTPTAAAVMSSPAPTAPISPESTALPTTTPQVIVVVIDGETGRPIDADALERSLADAPASSAPTTAAQPVESPSAPAPATPAPVVAPTPVAVPVNIPAPPPPRPAAPQVAAPAPAPEASSSGS